MCQCHDLEVVATIAIHEEEWEMAECDTTNQSTIPQTTDGTAGGGVL
jgi:hypothetical protein